MIVRETSELPGVAADRGCKAARVRINVNRSEFRATLDRRERAERRRRSPDKPAKAVRWTSTAVLVSIQIVPDDPLATRYVWLAADDVKRKITSQRQDEAHSDNARIEGSLTAHRAGERLTTSSSGR